MPNLDKTLARYDLRTLEEAVARRRREEERKLARLAAKQARLQKELSQVERDLERTTAGERRARKKGAPTRKPNARRLNDISLADALEKVLASRKGPVHYKEMTDAVVRRKLYRTKSKNLLSTVAVTLKRDKRFKKVEPGFYALR
jgi:hypothetical protein